MTQHLGPAATSIRGSSASESPDAHVATGARRALAVLVVVDIILLTALRIAGTGGPLEPILQTAELVCQAILLLSFAGLVLVDYRAAVAIAVLELACGGASGHWTVFPGGVSGRIMLDGLVLAGGLAQLGLAARAHRLRLGRYTVHAVVLAVVLPGVWMTLGLLNGNAPSDVFGDGNGHFFFAFAVALAALAQRGDLGWLRRWFLLACAANALVTAALALVGLSRVVSISTLGEILIGRLDFGGGLASWAEYFRLTLGSGLYLQVGMVLVTWELLRKPRRLWPWLLFGILAFDLVASWSRGYWLGASIAVAVVLLLGSSGLRRPAQILGVSATIFVAITIAGLVAGFSVPQYLFERAASAFAVGEESNSTKIEQARVLTRHIAERPVLGWGFGTIAPDYQYGQIYSYEIQYLDLAYKTGIVGLLLFLSFPLRLLVDFVRGRLGLLQLAAGVTRPQAAVPGAIIASVLVVGATNPYLLAAFGLAPIILSIAWLDPFDRGDAT